VFSIPIKEDVPVVALVLKKFLTEASSPSKRNGRVANNYATKQVPGLSYLFIHI